MPTGAARPWLRGLPCPQAGGVEASNAGRLSGVGKALGQGLREFREEAKVEDEESADDGSDSDEEKAKEEETSS